MKNEDLLDNIDNNAHEEKVITTNPLHLTEATKNLINNYLSYRVLTWLTVITLLASLGIYSFLNTMELKITNTITDNIKKDTNNLKNETYIEAARAKIKVEQAKDMAIDIIAKAKTAENRLKSFDKTINNSSDEIKKIIFENKDFLNQLSQNIMAQLSCPSPYSEAIKSFGFCIWHIPKYDKNFIEAANACRSKGARLCTLAELSAAQVSGAEWCSWGWVADRSKEDFSNSTAKIAFPMQTIRGGCGNSLLPTMTESVSKKFGANCCK